uniref:Uncharacterized protein n=1 Tax=Aegilops tauschii subsp. strangulata TaxID=200361 RepID=A0A453AJU8_AEGTS
MLFPIMNLWFAFGPCYPILLKILNLCRCLCKLYCSQSDHIHLLRSILGLLCIYLFISTAILCFKSQ